MFLTKMIRFTGQHKNGMHPRPQTSKNQVSEIVCMLSLQEDMRLLITAMEQEHFTCRQRIITVPVVYP